MIRHEAHGLVYYTFPSLEGEGIAHAVLTRKGGKSQPPYGGLNVGHRVGDNPQVVEANHRLILEHLGLKPQNLVTAHQVHGSAVAIIGHKHGGSIIPATDGLVTAQSGILLMLRFADCVPIFLYDPRHHTLALGHAGWRGIAAGLARSMVQAMSREMGSDPREIIAALGPAAGACCYTVGEEVIDSIKLSVPHWEKAVDRRNGAFYLDMWHSISLQLGGSGVSSIEISSICTAMNTEEFFSHRGEKGRTGRFACLAWLRE